MIDRADLLTWEGVRALATCEILTPSRQFIFAQPDPQRPPIKFGTSRHWFDSAMPMTPRPGEILFGRTAWRVPYRADLVKRLTVPAVLVSCFYDPTIKASATADLFAPGSPITHWFGVQVDTTHPQLTAMPVGVQGRMVPVLAAAERRETRDIRLYLNFRRKGRYQPIDAIRQQLWRHFSGLPWVTADPWEGKDPAHYATQLGRSQFVLSPRGFGWDCYRTYEAIAMGAIPIVKRKPPLTDHLEHMPALLVDRWVEVTPERLATEWSRLRGQSTERLTMRYWRDQILSAAHHAAQALVA